MADRPWHVGVRHVRTVCLMPRKALHLNVPTESKLVLELLWATTFLSDAGKQEMGEHLIGQIGKMCVCVCVDWCGRDKLESYW